MSGRIQRRHFLATGLGLASAVALPACSEHSAPPGEADIPRATADSALDAPGSVGLISEDAFRARANDYLRLATAAAHADNPTGIAAHLARAQWDANYTWASDAVSVVTLGRVFQQIDTWQDTRDFQMMYLHWVLALDERVPAKARVTPAVREAIEARYVAERYRYDDPLPPGRLDNLWYWSENHRLITLTNEYLAGQRFADRRFAVTSMVGRDHEERSRQPIIDWIEERGQFGFFEWHSNVYLLKDITALLTLTELAQDPEIVEGAACALDLCLLDLAVHLQAGAFTAPHGRSYAKDKMSSRLEATFDVAKLLFDDTTAPYGSDAHTGATYLCAATRYRVPQAVVDIARDDRVSVVRERHGVFFDGSQPVTEDVEAPFGYDFEERRNMAFWWSLGAVGMWPLARVGVAECDAHQLWDTELIAPLKTLADLNGRDPERIRGWLQRNQSIVNFGFLSEANTYAWRSRDVSLASVSAHRPGDMRDQAHSWQAQCDADALVFTTHPATAPPSGTEWEADGSPGYWTGEASMPLSVQFERMAIHMYQPKWDEQTDELLWSAFGYEPYTHAFVPTERFDAVERRGNWIFLQRGQGFIGLWSWRPAEFRDHDPTRTPTGGLTQPFDWVAGGGPDNVWLCEVASASEGHVDSLEQFADSLSGSPPEVHRVAAGFSVRWDSPSAGPVVFDPGPQFTVAGREIAVSDFPRHESPWGRVERLDPFVRVRSDSADLRVHLRRMVRQVG